MAILTCAICHVTFTGRPNKRYCTPACKQRARVLARVRNRQARAPVTISWGDPVDWGTPWDGGERWTMD